MVSIMSAKHISKLQQQEPILEQISLDIDAHQVVVLLGASGSGKSTLLQCLTGLLPIESGQVSALGYQDILSHKKMRIKLHQAVGMIFQQSYLWSHKTVLENILLAPVYGLKKSKVQVTQDASELLSYFQMAAKVDSYPHQLSGGQQQRVAIIRALVMEPVLMLCDEPTSALDPQMTRLLIQLIAKKRKAGMGFLIATHDLDFAKKIADEVIFLKKGCICARGGVDALFNQGVSPAFTQYITTGTHHEKNTY